VTGPVSAPPSCVLLIDGVRYADGQPAEADAEPVALTGLSVVWGRDTTIDQPAPATCTFTVLDRPGEPRFTADLVIGARVQVRADAVIYPDPSVVVIADPGFEAAPAGSTPSTIRTNAVAVVQSAVVHAGARAVRVDPVDAGRGVRVIFPPAPLSAEHDPGAWDAVPRTLPGQSWRYGAAVHVPTGLAAVARATVHPVTFTQPWAGSERVMTDTAAAGAADAGGWATHTALVTPPAGVWLGIAVDVYPTGPSWDDVPPGLAWDDVDPTLAWDDLAATFVDDLVLLAPAAGAARSGEVFTGRITDLAAQWDTGTGGTMVKVTAQDDTAELANRYVGTAPWAAEPLGDRFGRILTAAGQQMQFTVDPGPAARQVTYRDVDNQPAAGLLAELAQSAGGVLWSATSLTTGPYLRLEDVDARPPMFELYQGADLIIRIRPAPVVAAKGITLSACDVLLDPVHWEQDVGDVSTRVAVGWKDQAPDPVKPTDRTTTAIDAAAESANGQRRVQVSTQLATSADADALAASLLGRLSAGGWRIRGLTYRVDLLDPLGPAGIAAVMTILDATTRIGLPILLTDMPAWSPAPTRAAVPLYLEGARLTNDAGAWTLELITSSAVSQGAAGVAWDQLPAGWEWDQFDPAISWDDLRGVGI
jgi:hypothetical protein